MIYKHNELYKIMKRNTILIFLLMSFLIVVQGAHTKIEIKNLLTEYQKTPLGIDVLQPQFSWQMFSTEIGAMQTAYQLNVALSLENLTQEKYLYSTGKIKSGKSVGIIYNGNDLQPMTRYYWEVKLWDEKGHQYLSEPTWFETGLMNSGWNQAEWIGSHQASLSKYRSHYDIKYNVQIEKGSRQAVFVFGARDTANYVMAELIKGEDNQSHFIIKHLTDGKEQIDFDTSVVYAIPIEKFHDNHFVKLKVLASSYALRYYVDVEIDGISVKDHIEVYPYPDKRWAPYCRLYAIGFLQPEKQNAVFSNITIKENVWNTLLYQSHKIYREEGDHQLHIWTPSEETGAPMLRKKIIIKKPLKSARLYATARGIYEFYINGQRWSNDYFNPGSTDYRYRLMYNSYDITPFLKEGENGIGAVLGSGWWSDFTGYATQWQDQYGVSPSLLVKIKVEYTDGTQDIIVSDSSWKSYDRGPILSQSFQNGEDYDARREVPEWSAASFDDSKWNSVKIYEPLPDSVTIQYYIGNSVQHNMTISAVSVTEAQKGVFVYDMGQNMVGVPRIKVKGKRGDTITLHFGEMIYPEIIPEDPIPPLTQEIYKERKGLVYNENYRGALVTDNYILRGDMEGESYQPNFTFHGYRYIAIYGLNEALPLTAVEGIVLESVGKLMSHYETSDSNINRLYQNIIWGQRGNFLSIPTDCPQRDERLGWTGDAQVFARTATYNMNVEPFYRRWFTTVRDNQGIDGSYCNYFPKVGVPPKGSYKGGGAMGWMEAGIIIPWQVYQQYGDIRFIEEHYASMTAYMDYLQHRAVNDIQQGGGFGDWLAIEPTNTPLTNTAYYAYDALLMSRMATALNKKNDADRYIQLYQRIKETFNKEFVDENGYTKKTVNIPEFREILASGSSRDKLPWANTQTSYVVPLQVDLFNEKNKPLALNHLIEDIKNHNYTLTTGFIGTPYLNLVLSANGYHEVAYKLFEQTAYPSWLYPVLQGATTIWERWNSYTIRSGFGNVNMNSFNHYSYGAIEEWMMSYSIGIQRDEANPAYKHFFLQPKVGGTMSYIKGYYDSMYGRISSGWEKTNQGFIYKATVPANTTATLYLPVQTMKSVKFIQGQKGMISNQIEHKQMIIELKSGNYIIEVNTPFVQ